MRYAPKAKFCAKEPITRFFTRSHNRVILEGLSYGSISRIKQNYTMILKHLTLGFSVFREHQLIFFIISLQAYFIMFGNA